jgi:hypothetical protein
MGDLNGMDIVSNAGNSSFRGAFLLPIKTADSAFISLEYSSICNQSCTFKTPLANLNHFTIKLRQSDGTLYDFGSAVGSTAKAFQNTFQFRITCQDTVRKSLGQRNVY